VAAKTEGTIPEPLTWTVWPARQKPAQAAAAAALVLGVSWYGYVGFGSIVYSIVALVVLTGSLTFFLFPSTYTLDGDGANLRGFLFGKRKLWRELGCYLVGNDFVALSTSPEPTERTISRGMILRLEYNKDDVVAFVARHLPEWKAPEPEAEDAG
jgi:hypothetical protein